MINNFDRSHKSGDYVVSVYDGLNNLIIIDWLCGLGMGKKKLIRLIGGVTTFERRIFGWI